MSKFVFGRKIAFAIGLGVSLFGSSVAAAVSLGTEIILVVSPSVIAGKPITGYVAMGTTPMTVSCTTSAPCGLPPMNVAPPHSDPLFFSIPTCEPMQGSILSVTGGDADGHSKTKPVLIS